MKLEDIITHRPSAFHGVTIRTTPDKLMRLWDAAGIEYYDGNDGEGKTNFDFAGQIGDTPFYIYDWKYGRPLAIHTEYEFNVGAQNWDIATRSSEKLEELLADY